MSRVQHAFGAWFASGQAEGDGATDGMLLRSEDGRDWQRVRDPSLSGSDLERFHGFVATDRLAVGSVSVQNARCAASEAMCAVETRLVTSGDGLEWTPFRDELDLPIPFGVIDGTFVAANPTEETWVLRISTDGVQWTTAGEVLPVGLNTPIFAAYGSRLVIVDATDGVPWGIRVWVHEGLPGS